MRVASRIEIAVKACLIVSMMIQQVGIGAVGLRAAATQNSCDAGQGLQATDADVSIADNSDASNSVGDVTVADVGVTDAGSSDSSKPCGGCGCCRVLPKGGRCSCCATSKVVKPEPKATKPKVAEPSKKSCCSSTVSDSGPIAATEASGGEESTENVDVGTASRCTCVRDRQPTQPTELPSRRGVREQVARSLTCFVDDRVTAPSHKQNAQSPLLDVQHHAVHSSYIQRNLCVWLL